MEYQLKKEICPVCEAVFEGSSEQPVDLDLIVPILKEYSNAGYARQSSGKALQATDWR